MKKQKDLLTELRTAERNLVADIPPGADVPAHDCWDEAVPYVSDGALGHGWECGKCGAFLQAG